MQPVPGHGVSTPYGKRGKYWSCRKNSAGEGIHTGADFAAPQGTQIVAPISGQIRWRSYGSAFGNHQFAISPDPGQPFADGEVFFAHTTTRPANGSYVKAGDKIAKVGSEGNVTGAHLHMEYMPKTKGKWTCDVQANPQPVIDWQEEEDDDMPLSDKDIEKIARAVNRTLGDWNADGTEQDSADNPPKTASTRLREIAKNTDG